VRGLGIFLQDQLIYAVHFPTEDKLVGCREEELQPADSPWIPSRFEFRDRVLARVPLGIRGQVVVEAGEVGEILKVLRDTPGGVCYQVYFMGATPYRSRRPRWSRSDSGPWPVAERLSKRVYEKLSLC